MPRCASNAGQALTKGQWAAPAEGREGKKRPMNWVFFSGSHFVSVVILHRKVG